MIKEKRPTIDEGMINLILSRLFGKNYTKHPTKEGFYLGYYHGMIVEVYFLSFLFYVTRIHGGDDIGEIKFGNLVVNDVFATKGLRCTTDERIDFDNTTCAMVFYEKDGVAFPFFYKNKMAV